jgi:predicted dehydrogenase
MIRFAVVGCGGMANWHAGNLKSIDEARLTAFCDTMPSHTATFREKYAPDAAEFNDYERMLADAGDTFDAVVLVTPHTLHAPQAAAALRAGKHVLVEKPMVTSVADAYGLRALVEKTGLHLGITFQAPYTAEFQAIKSLRESGLMGTVQLVQGWLAQGWMKGTTGKWRQDPALSGGGQMYDSGAHVLNAIMWLMDEPVVEVSCMIDKLDTPVDINGVATMRFRSGAMGSVCIGGNSPGWDVDIRIQTDTMQIRTGPHGGFLEAKRGGKPFYPAAPHSDAPAAFTPHRNFVDALQGRAQLQAPVRYGVLLSALMDAMYESARLRAPVAVAPVPD